MGKHCLTQHEALEFHLPPLRTPISAARNKKAEKQLEKNESTFTPQKGKRKDGGHQQGALYKSIACH